MSEVVIEVNNLSKKYRLGLVGTGSISRSGIFIRQFTLRINL